MSLPRSVLSAPTVLAAVLGATWYISAALPIASAASAGEQTAVTATLSTEPSSGRQSNGSVPGKDAQDRPSVAADSKGGFVILSQRDLQRSLQQIDAQPATKPITPENPIPRRLSSVPIPYPLQLRGSGYHATVTLRVTLDSSGSIVDTSIAHLERGSATAPTPTPSDTDVQTFVAAATDAVKQWRYESPADPPIAFFVTVRFDAERDAVATQSDVLSGSRSSTIVIPQNDLATVQPRMAGPGSISGQALRVGGNIRPPTKTKHVNPAYSESAQAARVQGVVIMEVTIDEQGQVAEARVLRSVPLLDQAALAAVTQWEFTPTLLNGRPVPVIMTVTVQFSLN
jgi:TonB family protein